MKNKATQIMDKVNMKVIQCQLNFRQRGADFVNTMKDNSGASAIVDVLIGLGAAAIIGAVGVVALKAWAPNFFTDALGKITVSMA